MLSLIQDTGSEHHTSILNLGSLNSYLRLDSAAVEAVNLLPRADHPSALGSIFGVLNRCKTKMGQRLLDRLHLVLLLFLFHLLYRWLRQPLMDHREIEKRLDVVQALKQSTSCRMELVEGPLKSVPDLDSVVLKYVWIFV